MVMVEGKNSAPLTMSKIEKCDTDLNCCSWHPVYRDPSLRPIEEQLFLPNSASSDSAHCPRGSSFFHQIGELRIQRFQFRSSTHTTIFVAL